MGRVFWATRFWRRMISDRQSCDCMLPGIKLWFLQLLKSGIYSRISRDESCPVGVEALPVAQGFETRGPTGNKTFGRWFRAAG
jgi:hypothetical protein